MTAKKIAQVAADVKKRRADAAARIAFAEKVLTDCVAAFCDQYEGSLRQMARDLRISAPYLSDIRRGRRRVSDKIVERLAKLR